MKAKPFTIVLLLVFISSCNFQDNSIVSPKVEVRYNEGTYQLYRNGKPYYIKGVAGTANLSKAASYGANSVRTWNTDNIQQVLDEAHQNNMSVTIGLEVGKEYWGQDFDYWDDEAVEQKINEIQQIVIKYKDHPALLMWGVGNEVHIFGGNIFLVFITIDKIAKMIQETDPDHPVMTVTPHGPNFDKRGFMHVLCPNIDILGVNSFSQLPQLYEDSRSILGWRKAYLLAEWFPSGPWDASSTEWGAKRELSSTDKAKLVDYYWSFIQGDRSRCLGAYAFYWGQKFERTHTFVSLFIEDSLTTAYAQELQKIWKGKYEGNEAPIIDSLKLATAVNYANVYLRANTSHQVKIYAHDEDSDSLVYRWEIRPESLSDFSPGYYYTTYDYLIDSLKENQLFFTVPETESGYRIFSYVYDNHGHVSTQNLPFYVLPQDTEALP